MSFTIALSLIKIIDVLQFWLQVDELINISVRFCELGLDIYVLKCIAIMTGQNYQNHHSSRLYNQILHKKVLVKLYESLLVVWQLN